VDVNQQNLGGYPELSFKNILDCQGQFGLPSPMKFDEAIYTPIEKPCYFVKGFGPRGKKYEELAAWRRGATAPG
jgi:hypothetical protein